jgi:NADH-quinone oxidoreductase subunit C
MDAASLCGTLRSAVPDATVEPVEAIDQSTIVVARESLLAVCRHLRDDPALSYEFLAEVTAVDRWPLEAPRFYVVYHLACLGAVPGGPPPARLRLKVPLRSAAAEDVRLPTVSGLWPAAGWPEREVWDLFGIVFEDHPDLRRIMMPDEWEGHPLRKDYPVQVKIPVRTHEPLQVTEEEFVANIARTRQPTGRR